jgi:hypothetical protein
MGCKSLKAKATELKNSQGLLIGTRGHFRRATAGTSNASAKSPFPHQEKKEQDHDARSNKVNQPESNEPNQPAGLVVNLL